MHLYPFPWDNEYVKILSSSKFRKAFVLLAVLPLFLSIFIPFAGMGSGVERVKAATFDDIGKPCTQTVNGVVKNGRYVGHQEVGGNWVVTCDVSSTSSSSSSGGVSGSPSPSPSASGTSTSGALKYNATSGEEEYNYCGTRSGSMIVGFGIVAKIIYYMCGATVTVQYMTYNFMYSSVVLLSQAAGNILGLSSQQLIDSDQASSQLFNFIDDDSGSMSRPIEQVLSDPSDSMGSMVSQAYSLVLRIVNIALVVFFFIIALANILQIQLNQYAIKKIVPGLIIGFLIANVSMFIIKVGLEMTTVLTREIVSSNMDNAKVKGTEIKVQDVAGSWFVNSFSGVPFSAREVFGKDCADEHYGLTVGCVADNSPDLNKLFKLAINNIAMLAAGIMIFITGFLFIIRRFIFFFALPLAPLAFMSMYIPSLKGTIWGRWWKTVSGWLFMPLVTGFWIWLCLVWLGAQSFVVEGRPGDSLARWTAYIFSMIALYLAMRTPFSMAGEASQVLNKWSNLGKKAWGSTGGKALKTGGAWAGAIAADKTGVGALIRGYKKLSEASDLKLKNYQNSVFSKDAPMFRKSNRQKGKEILDTSIELLENKQKEHPDRFNTRDKYKLATLKARKAQRDGAMAEYKKELEDKLKENGKLNNVEKAQLAAYNNLPTVTSLVGKGAGASNYLKEKVGGNRDLVANWVNGKIEKQKIKANTIKMVADAEQAEAAQLGVAAMGAGYTAIQAMVENMKEKSGLLDQSMKDEIRMRKNNIQMLDKTMHEYEERAALTKQRAERAETDKVVKYWKRIEDNQSVLNALTEAEVHGKTRDKKKKDTLFQKKYDPLHRTRVLLDSLEDISKIQNPQDRIQAADDTRKSLMDLPAFKALDADEQNDFDKMFDEIKTGTYGKESFDKLRTINAKSMGIDVSNGLEAVEDLYQGILDRTRAEQGMQMGEKASDASKLNLVQHSNILKDNKADLAHIMAGRGHFVEKSDTLADLSAIMTELGKGTLDADNKKNFVKNIKGIINAENDNNFAIKEGDDAKTVEYKTQALESLQLARRRIDQACGGDGSGNSITKFNEYIDKLDNATTQVEQRNATSTFQTSGIDVSAVGLGKAGALNATVLIPTRGVKNVKTEDIHPPKGNGQSAPPIQYVDRGRRGKKRAPVERPSTKPNLTQNEPEEEDLDTDEEIS